MMLFTLLPILSQILINLRPVLQQQLSLVVSLICFCVREEIMSLLTSRDCEYLLPELLPDIQRTFLRHNSTTSFSSFTCSLMQSSNTIFIHYLACFYHYGYCFYLLQKQAHLREGWRIIVIKQYRLSSFILLKYLLSFFRVILTPNLIKESFLFLRLC